MFRPNNAAIANVDKIHRSDAKKEKGRTFPAFFV